MDKFSKAIQKLITEVFPEFKEILVVILYGSVSRKNYSLRHSDLDLFIIIKKKKISDTFKEKLEKEIFKVGYKEGVKIHPEFQGLEITYEDRTLVRKMIEEGRIIYSTGIFTFDNEIVGLKAYVIYDFSLKEAHHKTMFSKVLHGRKSWYLKGKQKILKEYPGIINKEDFIELGKGTLMVSKEKEKELLNIFKNFKVKHELKKIVYSS